MENEDIFIAIGQSKIYEPVTVLTNVIMTVMCLIFFALIKKEEKRRDINAWRMFFVFIALSSFAGCFVHGVHEQWGHIGFEIIKVVRNVLTLLAAFFSFRACLFLLHKDEKLLKKVNLFLGIYMITAVVVTIFLHSFVVTIIGTVLFILYTIYSQIVALRKGNAGSGWIVAAFGIMPLTILVHLLKIGNNNYFSSKDIAHVFIYVSLWFLYKGVRVMAKDNRHSLVLSTK